MPKTPALFEPVRFDGKQLRLLDETRLPEEEAWVSIEGLRGLLQAVERMQTRAFGQVLALAYGLILGEREGFSPEQVIQAFASARPTFPFDGIGRQILSNAPPGAGISEGALSFIQATLKLRRVRAERLAGLLPDPAYILTHCHVSGELGLALAIAKEAGKRVKAYPTLTRPYGQGVRLSAPEFLSLGIETELVADNAVLQILAGGKVNLVVIGSDRSSQQGDILNKVGSYTVAFLAKAFHVPLFALVQEMGADKTLPVPLPIEFRDPKEAEPPKLTVPVAYLYPSFDVVPRHLIAKRIGFFGVYDPSPAMRDDSLTPFRIEVQANKHIPSAFSLVVGHPTKDETDHLIQRLRTVERPVLVLEDLPALGGIGLAGRLRQEGLEAYLACDLMAGFFFEAGMVAGVHAGILQGAQGRLSKGTASASLLAKTYGIPLETFGAERWSKKEENLFRMFGASTFEGKIPVFLGEPFEHLPL